MNTRPSVTGPVMSNLPSDDRVAEFTLLSVVDAEGDLGPAGSNIGACQGAASNRGAGDGADDLPAAQREVCSRDSHSP
jgi:hypothetical protein